MVEASPLTPPPSFGRSPSPSGDGEEPGVSHLYPATPPHSPLLRAEKAGTVKAVKASPGDSLAVDAVILEFE